MRTNVLGTRFIMTSVALAGLLGGCTDLSSSDIKTSGINASLGVTANGNGSTVVGAQLHVGNSLTDYVELESGDALTARVADDTETLSESKLLGIINYSASFTDHDAPGSVYTIALERGAADTSAPASSCTLPAAFAITAPADAQTFSRAGDDIVVGYSGSGESDPLSWSASGDCVQVTGATLPSDTGTFTLPKGTLTSSASQSDAGPVSCQVTITVSRTRAGTLDPAYGGGGIACRQDRSFTFTSAP